ncbi:MAG: histidinol dehydrogenase, partial [Sphingomonas sp.]
MIRLDASSPGFADAFEALVDDRRESAADVRADVARIIADVRAGGADAVAALTLRLDRHDLAETGWRIDPA